MATTYAWKITGMKKGDNVDGMTNIIAHVTWMITATSDDGYTALYEGATPLEAPTNEDFITYDNLTESVVLSWIQAKLVDSYANHVYGLLEHRLNKEREKTKEVEDFNWTKYTPLQGYNL